ncbi:hypothetical protein LCGC14_2637730 [marine sediment metagenome]|uniref:Uncharacterized protein n=1 Tax=marine sediment metagenome TaxID=412755 RepID=A0A0F9CQT0_9ZZZZ
MNEIEKSQVVESQMMSVDEVVGQVRRMQEVMAQVMKPKIHYGIIPGTQKPTLYKPGSEKLLVTFRLGIGDPQIDDLSDDDHIRYRVITPIVHIPTGHVMGHGIGEASSEEEKYQWRKPVCEEEFDDTDVDRRREVWKKIWDKQKRAYATKKIKQVRTNPPDQANTILKMAKKRAQIDGTLTATAASDIFDQDLEDLPPEQIGDQDRQPPAPPQRQSEQQAPPPQQPAQDAPPQDPPPQGEQGPPEGQEVISEPQRRRLYAIWKASGWQEHQVKDIVAEKWGYTSSKDIFRGADYDAICKYFEDNKQKVEDPPEDDAVPF